MYSAVLMKYVVQFFRLRPFREDVTTTTTTDLGSLEDRNFNLKYKSSTFPTTTIAHCPDAQQGMFPPLHSCDKTGGEVEVCRDSSPTLHCDCSQLPGKVIPSWYRMGQSAPSPDLSQSSFILDTFLSPETMFDQIPPTSKNETKDVCYHGSSICLLSPVVGGVQQLDPLPRPDQLLGKRKVMGQCHH